MPIELTIFVVSVVLGSFGFCIRRIDANERRLDAIELKVCQEYIQKEDLHREFDRIESTWIRESDRLSKKLTDLKNND